MPQMLSQTFPRTRRSVDFQDHTYFTPSAVPTEKVALMLDELVARTAQSKGAGRSL
ncbi:hypothetical protein Aros01_08529 [Streptosporangium roseum]